MKRPSLIYQVKQTLSEMKAFGQSKHQDKQGDGIRSHIYSGDTYDAYLRHCCDFVNWCKVNHNCKYLSDCRAFSAVYVAQLRKSNGEPYSASTQKLIASSIAKLYQCSTEELGIVTPDRKRADITRSRGTKASDRHFSERNNADLIAFVRGTGLRNDKELQKITGDQFRIIDGKPYICDIRGKGGKIRNAPVLPEYADIVQKSCERAGNDRVWTHVSSHADIHSYRADYALAWYRKLARPIDQIPKHDQYRCRKDMHGIIFDKRAMAEVSKYLGHSRINVIAEHYLYRIMSR